MARTRGKFDWGSFLVGIVFIIAAMVAFKDPQSNLVAIVVIFAVAALMEGIYQVGIRRTIRKATGYKSTAMIMVGIINIIIGIVLLFNVYDGIIALSYVFAIWFIIKSLEGLVTSGLAKVVSTGYFVFTVLINILGVVLGVMLFKNPLSSMLTIAYIVGFYFMIFGILNIAEAFANDY